ncbi:hypothetical protein [Amycolatopsis decaplanina]|uniref:Response regulatory domain-containing protein n=1 Tax=Amycolatopsis decaplanina DSM 44594 TaxID=1284240 RepID=M2YK65_9PSEU|nr:hypothetical protein [Amycolatopsis decaplanina]EME55097.1 hypothetical protein H074_26352 [Amycolatopsis decaplanina DSM 44594]
MRILLTEAEFDGAREVAAALRDLGCRVSPCHVRSGVCRALAPGGTCLLDEDDRPDLTVDVRGTEPGLTPREFGVVCALRARVPIVMTTAGDAGGPVVPPGFEHRVTACPPDDLFDACRGFLRTRA